MKCAFRSPSFSQGNCFRVCSPWEVRPTLLKKLSWNPFQRKFYKNHLENENMKLQTPNLQSKLQTPWTPQVPFEFSFRTSTAENRLRLGITLPQTLLDTVQSQERGATWSFPNNPTAGSGPAFSAIVSGKQLRCWRYSLGSFLADSYLILFRSLALLIGFCRKRECCRWVLWQVLKNPRSWFPFAGWSFRICKIEV